MAKSKQKSSKPEKPKCPTDGIDLSKPRYDQDTFSGRAKTFFQTTNPLNLFASAATLERAKCIVTKNR